VVLETVGSSFGKSEESQLGLRKGKREGMEKRPDGGLTEISGPDLTAITTQLFNAFLSGAELVDGEISITALGEFATDTVGVAFPVDRHHDVHMLNSETLCCPQDGLVVVTIKTLFQDDRDP
jgi:hypothetical protein